MEDAKRIQATFISCTLVLIFVIITCFSLVSSNASKSKKEMKMLVLGIKTDLKQLSTKTLELQQNLTNFDSKLNSINKSVSKIDSLKKENDNIFLQKQKELQQNLSKLDAKIGNLNLIIE